MPQADLYFSSDHAIDAAALARIEQVIHDFDDSAGACKGRAHPVALTHHSHILLRLSMLPKAHRDAAYARDLRARLTEALRPCASGSCTLSVQIRFDLTHYTSVMLEPKA